MLGFDWIRRKLGYHVCRKFTPWEYKRENVRVIYREFGVPISRSNVTQIWQERRCTECGKIQQQRLKY